MTRPILIFLLSIGLLAGFGAEASAQATQVVRYQEAEALRQGKGVAENLAEAEKLHAGLVAEGYTRSLVRLADIYERTDRAQEALDTYAKAVESGDFYARIRLAQGHAEGRFGALSEPEKGFAMLEELVRDSDNSFAGYTHARAVELGSGTAPDPEKAAALYRKLAAAGHGMSSVRLGTMEFDGRLGPPDLEAAALHYKAAVDVGTDYGLMGLARSYLGLGRYEEARDTIDQAAAKGLGQAAAYRAIWNYEGDLGPVADKAAGRDELKALAEAGDVYAARAALINHERRSRRITTLDLPAVLAALEQKAAQGDTTAIKALARAYRELSWLIPDARAKHAALVEAYGTQLSTGTEAAETVTAQYDRDNHRTAREEAHAYLRSLDAEGYGAGMMRLRSIEQTSYVYALQKDLAELGYYKGRADGLASSGTIKAIFAFCRDEGFYDVCQHGPLLYAASRETAWALGRRLAAQ